MEDESDRPEAPRRSPERESPARAHAKILEHGPVVRRFRKLVVWFVGLLLDGRVQHNRSEYDIRNAQPVYVLYSLAGIATVIGAIYYLLYVIPDGIAVILVGIPIGIVAIRASLFGSVMITAYVVAAADDLINDRYGPGWD